jgi:2-dehydropantoate 2-reductase
VRVAILGCGSLGGVIAVRLASHPEVRLTVWNRDPRIAEAAAGPGLWVRQGRSVRSARLKLSPPERPPEEELDCILLATKSGGLMESARRLAGRLSQGGFFLTVQNGLIALDLAEELGSHRVLPGCVLWGATMTAPGQYTITAPGAFLIGSLQDDSRSGPRVQLAQRLLRRVFPVRNTPNIRGVLWSKLAVTASFTTLGAITGLPFGELASTSWRREVVLSLGREVLAVATARGQRLEPLGSGFDVERLLSDRGYPPLLRYLLLRLVAHRHRRTVSGMLESLRRGQATEVAFVNGRVARLAEEAGVSAPFNRLACELVGELERGALHPDPSLIERFRVLASGRR